MTLEEIHCKLINDKNVTGYPYIIFDNYTISTYECPTLPECNSLLIKHRNETLTEFRINIVKLAELEDIVKDSTLITDLHTWMNKFNLVKLNIYEDCITIRVSAGVYCAMKTMYFIDFVFNVVRNPQFKLDWVTIVVKQHRYELTNISSEEFCNSLNYVLSLYNLN